MKLFVLLLLASVVYGDWVVKRNKQYLTCSNDYRIKEYSTDLAGCEADAEAEGATHIYWQKGEWRPAGTDWCHLYTACPDDDLREPAENGITYYNDAANGWTVKSFRTCSEEERIEKVNVELEDCKAEAESLGAAHIYWQAEWQRPVHTTPLCHIYGTCNGGNLRTPAENGVNMVLI